MDFEAQQRLTRDLGGDERLLWTGRPRGGVRLVLGDVLMIPFSLMWGGFAIYWEYSAIHMGAPGFFALWGIPFVLVGLYLIFGRFFYDAYRRAHTYYGLTTDRVLIVSEALGRKVRSLYLSGLAEMDLAVRTDGTGTITFGTASALTSWMTGWPGAQRNAAPRFEAIEQARQVYDQIRAAQRARPVGA